MSCKAYLGTYLDSGSNKALIEFIHNLENIQCMHGFDQSKLGQPLTKFVTREVEQIARVIQEAKKVATLQRNAHQTTQQQFNLIHFLTHSVQQQGGKKENKHK